MDNILTTLSNETKTVYDPAVTVYIKWGCLKNDKLNTIEKIKPFHGTCGQAHDDCVCEHNEWVNILQNKIQNYIPIRGMLLIGKTIRP